jgi:hypothetical protein
MGFLGNMFRTPTRAAASPAPIVVPTPVAAPTVDDTEVKAAEEKQRKLAALAKGRESTILTGGLGLTDEAPTTQKTLLG